jgi:hypothetical protein
MRFRNPQKAARAVAYFRRNGQPERARQLEEQLAAYGLCKRCGRRLTDKASLARGIGPECWKQG